MRVFRLNAWFEDAVYDESTDADTMFKNYGSDALTNVENICGRTCLAEELGNYFYTENVIDSMHS